MPPPPRRAFAKRAAIVICCLVFAYPLSYAPMVRSMGERHGTGWGSPLFYDGRDMPVYRPIDWIIDNTLLDKPMFVYACLWGVWTCRFHSHPGESGKNLNGDCLETALVHFEIGHYPDPIFRKVLTNQVSSTVRTNYILWGAVRSWG